MTLSEGDKVISAIHRKTALVDHITLIPAFSGEQGSISYGEFRRSFDRLAGLYGWEEQEKIFVLFTRVTGAAAQLLRTYEKEAKTFVQLTDILSNRYDKKDSPAVALQKFMTFRQTSGMSVQEFFDKAKHLSLSALVVDGGDAQVVQNTRTEMLKSMLLSNLSPEIKKGVVAKDPKNPDEILKWALLEEKSWEAVRADTVSNALLTLPSSSGGEQTGNHFVCAAAHTQKNKNQDIEELKEQVKQLTAQVASLVSVRSQEKEVSKEVICFNCKLPGHYARNCVNFGNQRGNWGNNRNFTNNRGGYQQQRGNWQGSRRDNYNDRADNNNFGRNSNNDRRDNRGSYRNNRGNNNATRGDRGHQADDKQQSADNKDSTKEGNNEGSLNR